MGTKITVRLSHDSIQSAIREIESYKRTLNDKCRVFCDRLYDYGISVARVNKGHMGDYIVFSKKVVTDENGVTELLVMSNSSLVTVEWLTVSGDLHYNTMNPIMIAEFGSGWHTDEYRGQPWRIKMGSWSKYGHAKEKEQYWHYQTLDGVWHTSDGEEPTYPLLKAYKVMVTEIDKVGREVFGS